MARYSDRWWLKSTSSQSCFCCRFLHFQLFSTNAMPYPFQVVPDGVAARMPSPRVTGPYKNGSSRYVCVYNTGTEDNGFTRTIEMYRSDDDGETWDIQDSGNSPLPYADLGDSLHLSTFQDGTDIVVIYLENGGPIINGTENARLCFRPFHMESNTWGSLVSGGPTIYDSGVFPDGMPPGGWSGYEGGEWTGYVGLGLASGVRRASGEYVFVYDSHDQIHETEVNAGIFYRRVSVVRYNGTWSAPTTLFEPVFGVTLREFFAPQAVLGADDTVHIFCGSVGALGEEDTDYLTITSMWAHYATLSDANVLGSEYIVSEDLDYQFTWTSLGKAIRIGSTLYLPYRKGNGTLAVTESDTLWVAPIETEVAELANAVLMPLAVVMVASGSNARLLWIDAEDADSDQIIYSSISSGAGIWGAATTAFTLGPSNDHGTDLFSGLAMSDAIGLTLLYGASTFSFPLEYIQLAAAAVSSARNRYVAK